MSDEETAIASAEVPKSTYELAKDKLPYGGISKEIRGLIERIAHGDDLNQRSRLEQRLRNLREQRRELQQERREIDVRIENIDSRIQTAEREVSQLTEVEERYEAKIEMLEQRLRDPDNEYFHLLPDLRAVRRIAEETGREPEGVVADIRDRNPDVPEYAFEEPPTAYDHDPIHNPRWNGFNSEEEINRPVGERRPPEGSE